ncbi:AAA-like domain-containing protein [Oscillatoria sp. FACHB-1407]|uniref:AAA-like domain-containing protein n=1 Tax=Oscillatoria sp. FACHB-1407 TaxID=2692847 RepID=UPI0016846D50|nr:AAA-like domain-containing protein [Oscillatoria sp. FACHB-1407]MBD2461547.1 AAA-like domain-containing protein [Oscillatoria sp. FACHB-1407]
MVGLLNWLKKKEASPGPPTPPNPLRVRVVISYVKQTSSDREPASDDRLASTLNNALTNAGYQVSLITQMTPHEQIEEKLGQCDYFVLLLSFKAALNEIVQKKIRWVRERREQEGDRNPAIVPIRVKFSRRTNVSYDTKNYLDLIEQLDWKSDEQTSTLANQLLEMVANRRVPVTTAIPTEAQNRDVEEGSGLLPALRGPWEHPREFPGAIVPVASPLYIERPPIETLCNEQILQPGALVRIKAPSQMGKSSLLGQILYHAQRQQYRTVLLNLQDADTFVLNNADQFLRWFCTSISQRLSVVDRVNERWDLDSFNSWENCTSYLAEYLLREVSTPIVLGLDKIDLLFDTSFAASFFSILRSWHEEAKTEEKWQRLRLVLTYATESYVQMPLSQSPFNVGLAIDLPEFSSKQVIDLTRRYKLDWSILEVSQLLDLVGGHPYLVRLALYNIASQQLTLNELLNADFSEHSIYDSHLRSRYWRLDQNRDLKDAFTKLIKANGQSIRVEKILAFKLQSLGLVDRQGDDEVQVRCKLYQRYFEQVL